MKIQSTPPRFPSRPPKEPPPPSKLDTLLNGAETSANYILSAEVGALAAGTTMKLIGAVAQRAGYARDVGQAFSSYAGGSLAQGALVAGLIGGMGILVGVGMHRGLSAPMRDDVTPNQRRLCQAAEVAFTVGLAASMHPAAGVGAAAVMLANGVRRAVG